MKKLGIFFIILIVSLILSCKDFLREYSQNDAYVEEISDLEELLAGECYLERITQTAGASLSSGDNNSAYGVKDMLTYIHVLDDDIMESIIDIDDAVANTKSTPFSELYHFYRWSDNPYINNYEEEITDPYWAKFYYRIAVLNAILVGADELEEKGKSITELSRIRGETLFLRAWNFFMLANIFGMPYDKKNPDDPYGIPLKIVSEVMDKDFKRNTVGEVYTQIVKDLEDAAENFESIPRVAILDFYTPGIMATYALLSRVYLYMEEYEKVIEVADKVKGFALQNLNYLQTTNESFAAVYTSETIFNQGSSVLYLLQPGEGENKSYELPKKNPETGLIEWILTEIITNLTFPYAVSNDLANLFDENDLRYKVFFTRGGITGNLLCRKYGISTDNKEYDPVSHDVSTKSKHDSPASSSCWIRYTEVLLNKMEALACLGDADVHSILNTYLTSRYKTVPVPPSSGMELISFIRRERRKELCFEGHRWFDIRRYAVSSFPEKIEIEHPCYDVVLNVDNARVVRNVGSRTLKAFDESTKGCWVHPIPSYVREDNHGAITNISRTSGVESNTN